MIDFAYAIALRAAALAGFGLGASALPLYVAPAGTGSICSQSVPCALVTALSKHGNVVFEDGFYRLPSTISITSLDSNRSWSADSGARPVLGASVQPTSSFTTYSDSIQKASVPVGTTSRQLWIQAAGSNVWLRRVRAQTAASSVSTWTSNSNGFAGTSTLGGLTDKLGIELRGQGAFLDFRCPVSAVTNAQLTWANPCGAVAFGGDAGGIIFNSLATLENSLSFLSQGGEWFLDTNGLDGPANTLYYWPTTNDGVLNSADVEIPILSTMVSFNGVQNFTVKGLQFSFAGSPNFGTDGYIGLQGQNVYQTVASATTPPYLFPFTGSGSSMAAIVAPGNISVVNSHINFVGDLFAYLGGTAAITFENGSNNSLVDTSNFYDISGTGIVIGSSMLSADEIGGDPSNVHDIAITRNAFTNVGQDFWQSPAIQGGYIKNVTIANNDIEFSPYDGNMIGGFVPGGVSTPWPTYGLVSEKYNLTRGVMHRDVSDGAGDYYTGNQNLAASSSIFGDLIDNAGRGPQALVYFDTFSSGIEVSGSVLILGGSQTCLYYVQTTPDTGLSNLFTGNWSDVSTACNTPDPSNTFVAPTFASNIDSSVVAATYAASGYLRGKNIAYGKSVVVSSSASGTSGANLVDDLWSDINNTYWVCTSPPCVATIDLGSIVSIGEIDLVYQWGNDTPSQRVGYTISVSNDNSTFTQVGSVDTSGTFQSYFYGSLEPFFFRTALTGRYVQFKAQSNGIAFAEALVHPPAPPGTLVP